MENLQNTINTAESTGIPFNQERHDFRVTDTQLELGPRQLEELASFGEILPDYVLGLQRLMVSATVNDKAGRRSPVFRGIRNMLGLNREFDLKPAETEEYIRRDDIVQSLVAECHPVVRLDCVIDPEFDELRVVEIEVDKLHGLGYARMCREMSTDPVGVGNHNILAALTSDLPTIIINSNLDRFYTPELRYFASAVNAAGGNLTIVEQDEVFPGLEFGMVDFQAEVLRTPALLQIPNLRGSNRAVHCAKDMLRDSHMDVLFGNNPNLANKAFMAIIHNSFGDSEQEEQLEICCGKEVIAKLRTMIPETVAPNNKYQRRVMQERIMSGERFFCKANNGSGARGIVTPDNTSELIQLAMKGKNVIFQRAIKPFTTSLGYMQMSTGETGEDDFSLRLGAFYFEGDLAEVAVTASPGILAHGGNKSIQMAARRVT